MRECRISFTFHLLSKVFALFVLDFKAILHKYISFIGKLHELHRERAESLVHTVRRVMVSALKTLTPVKRDRSKITMTIPEKSVVLFSPKGSVVDAMSLCNDDWVDGMNFVVKDVLFTAIVAPPEVSELSCFPMRFIMAGNPIIAYAR
jgi:hypothetical protein